MQQVSVVGNSGAGKTTLGRRIAAAIGAPFIELDSIFHQPGWEPLPDDEFRGRVAAVLEEPCWVVDGNYSVVRELVWAKADTVVWLDPPRDAVMRQIVRRTLRRTLTRQELWNGNREPLSNLWALDPDKSIVAWAWNNHDKYRRRYAAAAEGQDWPGLRFERICSKADGEALLAGLTRSRSGHELG